MKLEYTPMMSLIIDYILINENASIQSIADALKLSSRQVRYHIEKTNVYFEKRVQHHVIETNNKGNIVIVDRNALFQVDNLKHDVLKQSKAERIIALTLIAAFSIKKFNINELSRQLHVSRNTIKKDVEDVKVIFAKYHIILSYDKQFSFKGNYSKEELFQLRLAAMIPLEYILYQENYMSCMEHLIHTYICIDSSQFVYPKVIFPMIHQFFNDQNVQMKGNEYFWFCNFICLILWYLHQGEEIPCRNVHDMMSFTVDCRALLADLENLYNVRFSALVIHYIHSVIHILMHEDIHSQTLVDMCVLRFIVQLFIFYDKQLFPYKLYKDQQLMLDLYHHLYDYVKKQDTGIMETIFPQLESMEPLDHLLTVFCEHNRDITFKDQRDQLFVNLYIRSGIDRNQRSPKKRVVIVSNASQPISERLASSLQQAFEIQVLDVITRYELAFYEMQQETDFILFTEQTLNAYAKRYGVLQIHSVLTDSDIHMLFEHGFVPKRNVIQEGLAIENNKGILQNYTIQYAQVSLFEGAIKLYNNVYLVFDITDSKMDTIITIDCEHKNILLTLMDSQPMELLRRICQFYALFKDESLRMLLCKHQKKDVNQRNTLAEHEVCKLRKLIY